VDLPHVPAFQPNFDRPDRWILRQVSLRCSEGFIVIATLKCLARIDATLFVEDVTIQLHSLS
jgi:hypothetical protein